MYYFQNLTRVLLYQLEEEINEPDFGNFSKCNEQVLCL